MCVVEYHHVCISYVFDVVNIIMYLLVMCVCMRIVLCMYYICMWCVYY